MKTYELHNEIDNLAHLPGFAKFLLDNHLEPYVREQLELCYRWNVPLLQLFKHLTPEEVFELGKNSNRELLTVLADNRAKEHLETSLQKWVSGQHEMVGRFDVAAEDITLLNHVRQKVLKKWILCYTTDPAEILALSEEIDAYTFVNNTSGTNTYIKILTEKLETNTRQLLEAQSIAQIGSFEWDFVQPNRNNSPEMRKIFETEVQQSYEEMMEKVHPDDREKVRKSLERSLVEGTYDCEYRYIINNKEKVLWTKGVVHFEGGKPVMMTGTVQDVTERKKIEQNLLQKTMELEELNTNLEKFAFIASHDLQEPLRKILMHANLLVVSDKERLTEKGKGFLDKITTSAVKMKNLIKDILAYSTVQLMQDKEIVSLQGLLEEVKTELDDVITGKNVTIQSQTLPDALVLPSQIKQLFQNLVTNSIKFARKDVPPVITIRYQYLDKNQLRGKALEPATRYLSITFRDNGIGFPKSKAQEIFTLFKRLHSQKEFEGSGLGLAICRKVVDNHGGSIEASSNTDQGATFTILLPQ